MSTPRGDEPSPARLARCKAHYGDPAMSDEQLVRTHLGHLNAGYPQTAGGISTDTGLTVERVESLLPLVGARRHPLRDRRPRTVHTPPVRWSLPRE